MEKWKKEVLLWLGIVGVIFGTVGLFHTGIVGSPMSALSMSVVIVGAYAISHTVHS